MRRPGAVTSIRTAAWRGLLAGTIFWLLMTLIAAGYLAASSFAASHGQPATASPNRPSELDGLVLLPLLALPFWRLAWASLWIMHVPWHFLAAGVWFWAGLAWMPVHSAWFNPVFWGPWQLWVTSGLTGLAVTATLTVVITYALRTVLIRIPRQPPAPDW